MAVRLGAQLSMNEEIIVDNFAGGGGASTGIELACGRPVTIAINHDPDAILMHKTNHPYTEHYQASVWDVDPREVCRGRPVGLLWASPDCKHFSKAKGGKPVDKKIRGLAWIALRWAGTVRPRVIILENVEEFQTWGPVRRGKPVKARAGETFQKFVRQLAALGYDIQWRELVAADYGAPTIRKRFFLVARCDGRPILWPERTHAPADSPEVRAGLLEPWRSAAEIIDWSLPCPSIFDTKEEIRARYGLAAQRPLKPNTLRRVARGLDKFVLKAARPFLVEANHTSTRTHYDTFRGGSVDGPLKTVTASLGRGVCEPTLAPWTVTNTSNAVGAPADEPTNTARTGGGGGQMLVTPVLTAIGQTGGGDRIRSVTDPTHTQCSKAEELLTAPALLQYHTEQSEAVRGQEATRPLCTVDAANRYGLMAPSLVKYYGSDQCGQDVQAPLHTVTANDREGLIVPYLEVHHAGGYHGKGNSPEAPLNTITTTGGLSLNAAHVVKFKGQDTGQSPDTPLHTVTTSAGQMGVVRTAVRRYGPGEDLRRWPQVRELLNAHCGYHLAEDEVLLLLLGRAWWFVADVGLRMLTPRELYAANGFPPDYIIDRDYLGNAYGKSKQVARCGNAVPPPFATALVRANLPEWCGGVEVSTMAELERMVAV